ncbi:uncharacterized protein LOC113112899 isoform X3 [Carassius auratus]|uniref:Uncharacterized protein LOC113112899 isoform X3 n=1 Tax=Carassius auratus TaxID=7957 RepID=A0A6P6QNB2_CARAU|nr:uncharacterized protein LOC113112899 isoform X3 [Carassius auratus]
MATRRRKPPKQDAIEHAVKALDKTAELEVQYINSFKGRGVFAKTPFRKGDFVVEYRGELINSKESQRRRRTYHNRCAVFMFDFYWQEKTWCVDAAREDGSLGRLVNDDHKHPNCKMKRVITEGKPHLCLFALKDINEGEEITYDYGGTDWPWRKQEDKQSDATESFETDIFRTTEQTPQRSSSFKTQEDKQSDATESFETDIFRTTEQTPQRSSSFKTQCPHDPEPLPSMNKVGMNPSLVDYTDSDESQSPSTNHDQFNSSCQTWCPTSEFEISLTHQDGDYIPRLRRTKSIQMNRKVEFASDELFDPTSGSSGEEYIPHSSEDSSEGTDTSEVIQPVNQKESMLRFPILGKYADIGELNDVSSKQILNRGRSPSRRGGNSGMRRKRQCSSSSRRASYPTTHASSGHSTKRSGEGDPESVLQKTTPDLEKDLPDSASSLHTEDVADGSLSISAVCKKENGSRMYNKKQYCLYCREGFVKMARHLERAHKDKPEVAQALSFPKGSKERRMHMEYLRNRGNFAHNVHVLNAGVGNLVPRKQPRKDCQAQNFLHCIHCHGFFTKKVLWRHMMTCKFKPSVPQKPGKTRVQALCAFAVPPPPGVKVEFWKLLNNMVQDEVYSVLKSDVCIMEYGEHLYNRLGYDVGKHEYIRQKLRELGRLLICSRKTTSLKTIKDHVKPANFMQVVESVKHLAGYDSKTHSYRCPSLALKIGHNLTKISMLLESHANLQNDYSAAKDARTFRRVYETRWNELISAASLRTLQESKWNTPLLLPFTKDVQTLHSYLDVQQQDLYSKLSTEVSPQTWAKLAKVILAQVILFNRRRAGEVSKMTLSAYVCQNPSDPHEDVNEALSDLEKKLCQHFSRIEIRGKRGRKVPVLLTPVMKQGLDLLVGTRQECEVPRENVYLFARPSALTCYRGSDCLRHFAKVCGAKSPESLTSTKLRKQTGTLSQVLNLSNTELDQLADFLGHDVRVHRQFYRLPEGTLQLAKISKVLMALDQGRLAEFKGKTLDDINIDPEENVLLDSEHESESESQVTTTQREENDTAVPDVSDSKSQKRDKESQVTTTQREENDTAVPDVSDSKSQKRDKGRQPFKRKMWEKEEILAVEKHMMSFITSCRVPGKSDCDKCLELEKVALKNRNWLAIKFYIKNRITALKNKV